MIGSGEAAARLGVSTRRLLQMLHSGDLDGQQVSGRWVVDEESLRRVHRRPSAGRPLSPSNAWALLAVVSSVDLSTGRLAEPWHQVRAGTRRHRLKAFVRENPAGPAFAEALRRRAAPHRYWAHPGVLAPMLGDETVSVAGARAAAAQGLDLAPGSEARAYVLDRHLAGLLNRYALEPDPAGGVELLVVPADVPEELAPRPGLPVGMAVALVDLLTDLDARSRHLAVEQLEARLTLLRTWAPGSPSGTTA